MNVRELRQALKNESEDVTKFRYFVALDTALSIVDSFERDLKNRADKLDEDVNRKKMEKYIKSWVKDQGMDVVIVLNQLCGEVRADELRRVLGQDSSRVPAKKPKSSTSNGIAPTVVPEKKKYVKDLHKKAMRGILEVDKK